MSIDTNKRTWMLFLQRIVVFAFMLGWTFPAHANPCNAVTLGEQSLTIHWDQQTVTSCLNELQSTAQELEKQIDQDSVDAAVRAVDRVCTKLETKHLSEDAERICAQLRAGTKKVPHAENQLPPQSN